MKNSSVTSTFTLSRKGCAGGAVEDVAGLAGGAPRIMTVPTAIATMPSTYRYLRRFIKPPDAVYSALPLGRVPPIESNAILESLFLENPYVAIEDRIPM